MQTDTNTTDTTITKQAPPIPPEVSTYWAGAIAASIAAAATPGTAVAQHAEELAKSADTVEVKRSALLALIAGRYGGTEELPSLAKIMAIVGLLPGDSDWLNPIVHGPANTAEDLRNQICRDRTRLAALLFKLVTQAPDALLNQLAFDPGANAKDEKNNVSDDGFNNDHLTDDFDPAGAKQFSVSERASARARLPFKRAAMTAVWGEHVVDLMALNIPSLRKR